MVIIVRDREIIARNLINIIDVKNCQYFSQFMNDDLYDKLYDYLIKLSRGNDKAVAHTKLMMEECRPIMKKSKKTNRFLMMNSILLWKNSECLKGNILCKNAFPIS